MDRDAVSSRRIAIDDYPIFTKVNPLEILQYYISYCIASSIESVAYSYDEFPDAPLEPPPRSKRKASKKVGDGPFGTIKSPTKVVKALATMRRPLGTVLEAEDEGSENTEKVEETLTLNQTYSKSSIADTYFPSDHVVNISYLFTPLQPTPQIPPFNKPFGTIYTHQQKQYSTIKPYEPEPFNQQPSETIPPELLLS